MPELPEVETIARDLRRHICGLTINAVKIHDGRVVRQKTQQDFIRQLRGETLTKINRRGKAIMIELGQSHRYFIVQLMMTGQLIYSADSSPQRDTKVTFALSNGKCLHYNDYRTFGRLQVVGRLEDIAYFKTIGPEPLERDFTITWLQQELRKRQTPIKPLLLNHRCVAGIGNIYASEILFASGVDPRRAANSLQKKEIQKIHQATKIILRQAIRARGTSMNTYRDAQGKKGTFMNRIKVYGRDKEQCFNCNSVLFKEFQSGRSTFYCPQCQK